MAGTRKVGEKIPLAVVGKDGIKEDGRASTEGGDERETTLAQLTESLKALRMQVESLSSSLAETGGRAGRAVADNANAARETMTSTVRTYPFSSLLAASVAAFLIGRLTAPPARGMSDQTYDQLSRLAARLPHLLDAVRSRLT